MEMSRRKSKIMEVIVIKLQMPERDGVIRAKMEMGTSGTTEKVTFFI